MLGCDCCIPLPKPPGCDIPNPMPVDCDLEGDAISMEDIIDAACPFELPMMGFLTACTVAGAGAGAGVDVEVAVPEKSAKPPLLSEAVGAGLLLMNPNDEPEDVEGAGGAAAGGGLMNPKPDEVDDDDVG